MFIAPLLMKAKTEQQPECQSADERIKKMWCIYTMEYYSAIKKKCICVSAKEVDEPITYYTE